MGRRSMSSVGPGEAGFEESMARIAKIMQETQAEVGDIRQMSAESFRQFLDRVIQRTASKLGIAVAAAAALIADITQMARRAKSTFLDSYNKAKEDRRQIR